MTHELIRIFHAGWLVPRNTSCYIITGWSPSDLSEIIRAERVPQFVSDGTEIVTR
ncbi:hypothetical protein KPK_A0153 (plasmid) [Klebsiella variicola]|uniref:Uncharacterized protein n=1 Tax=Klebsiella variicola (strain 342) TaxID=507522 RepID=B5RK76_KLEV3|nr:hypothetical protein KPK_A0153 [Klebsiella variicola]